ncbi:hypothetical protein PBRA_003429 [Plasmodiophora brassicae]|uniref:Rho-GAP domain-containing protein n=1 Tax=Plasmodiophora brassicae TaxID=37360 RepID=A0A0G4J8I0_PLABS|nr:hypothetical protein PBRA_003429 [Plasmodiophora brassicae]
MSPGMFAILLLTSACAAVNPNDRSWDREYWHAGRPRLGYGKSYPDLRKPSSATNVHAASGGHQGPDPGPGPPRRSLRQTIREFTSQMVVKTSRRGSAGQPGDRDQAIVHPLTQPPSPPSAWKRSLDRIKTKLSPASQDPTNDHPRSSAARERRQGHQGRFPLHFSYVCGPSATPTSSLSDDDPFRDGMPHVVRVLLNTIYAGKDIKPSTVQGVFRVAPSLKSVDRGMAQLSRLENEMPRAHRQREKRIAAFYLKRCLRRLAESGHPLLPDTFVELVTIADYSLFSNVDLLCAGRRRTLHALRELLQWLVRMQRGLAFRESITMDGLAVLLAPSLVNPYYISVNGGIPFQFGFLPNLQTWLQVSP